MGAALETIENAKGGSGADTITGNKYENNIQGNGGDDIIDGLLPSHSMGKSLVSYVTGHAICEGYIGSINSKLNDWPLIENTLYYDQEFINLLNMQAGDNKYVWSSDFLIPTNLYGADDHVHDIEAYMSEFKNSKKGKSEFNYLSLIHISRAHET